MQNRGQNRFNFRHEDDGRDDNQSKVREESASYKILSEQERSFFYSPEERVKYDAVSMRQQHIDDDSKAIDLFRVALNDDSKAIFLQVVPGTLSQKFFDTYPQVYTGTVFRGTTKVVHKKEIYQQKFTVGCVTDLANAKLMLDDGFVLFTGMKPNNLVSTRQLKPREVRGIWTSLKMQCKEGLSVGPVSLKAMAAFAAEYNKWAEDRENEELSTSETNASPAGDGGVSDASSDTLVAPSITG